MNNLPDPNLGLATYAGRLEDTEFTFAPFDPAEPLPEYTRSWGPHLRRPPQLPHQYDTRIDPNHIFLFAVHPITGIKRDFYVTPKPCEYCAKIRQVCSRSRPSCQRCAVSGDPDRVCHVEDGWVKLPGPKCEKPKLQKRTANASRDEKQAKARSSTSDSMPVPKRARTLAPHPFDESLSPLSSTPTPSVQYEPMPLPKKPLPKRVTPVIRGENGQESQSAVAASTSSSSNEASVNGRKRAVAEKLAGRRGKRPEKRVIVDGKGKETEEGRWLANDGTIWHVIRPPPGPLPSSTPRSLAKLLHDESVPPRFTPQGKPRIWAKNKAEFLEVLPWVSDAMKGHGPGVHMEYATLEPPMVYLEGHAWPKDSLTAEGSAEITLVRDFTISAERGRGHLGTDVDYGGDDMMLVDEISESRSSASTPSLLTPRSQSVADMRPTAVSCHPSRALSAKQSPSTPQPQASTSRQADSPSVGPQAPSIRKVYSPLSSKLPEAWLAQTESSQHAQSPQQSRPQAAKPAPQTPTAPSLSGRFGGSNNSIHQSDWGIHQQQTNIWHPDGSRRFSDPGAQRLSPGSSVSRDSDDLTTCRYPTPSHRTYKMGEDFREKATGEGIRPHLHPATFTPGLPQRRSALDDDSPDSTYKMDEDFHEKAAGNGTRPHLPSTTSTRGFARRSSALDDDSPDSTFKMGEGFREKVAGERIRPHLPPATYTHRFARRSSALDDDSPDEDAPHERSISQSRSRSIPARYDMQYKAVEKTKNTVQDLDALNRDLSNRIPETALEREVLETSPTVEEEKLNFFPEEVPQDVKHLLDCKTYQIPVVLVVSRDYLLLPFNLPEDCGICVLGFYKIVEVERTALVQSEDDEERTVRVTWHFKLRWVPGGENAPEDQQPTYPWWQNSAALPAAEMDEPSPHSLLPMHLRSEFDKPSFEATVASELVIKKGWHCVQCGRLNVQRLLCFQKCETCQAGNDMIPVDAQYVRDPHKMTPDATPLDRYPETVTVNVLGGEKGGLRTFVYAIGDSVEIKHVFTCNRTKMQQAADRLFLDFQMEVPMTWQGAKTKVATGPYFTCLVGVGHEGHPPSIGWTSIPPSVKLAREVIETWATKHAAEENFRIDQLTILGWHKTGSRKGTALPNRGRTIAMLCLGSDIELNITPKHGFPVSTRSISKQPERVSARQAITKAAESEDEFSAVFDGPLSSSEDEALSTRRAASTRAMTERKPTESMFVILVHGDMLLLSGDEFEYTLHRTGMSMLLIGTQYAKGIIRNG